MKNSESDTISTHSFMESKERLVKICGMKYPENIQAVAALHPDFMGFIFYPKSKRFVKDESIFEVFPNAEKVGVFVNESIENILEKVEQYKLDVVIYGNELPVLRLLSNVLPVLWSAIVAKCTLTHWEGKIVPSSMKGFLILRFFS